MAAAWLVKDAVPAKAQSPAACNCRWGRGGRGGRKMPAVCLVGGVS
jgi:hypothetical protein